MAIPRDKYVEITSKSATTDRASRRSLEGRVFTTNPLAAQKGIIECYNADEVMAAFGADSKEYAFAAKYFRLISRNVTCPEKLSFANWNYANTEAVASSWTERALEITDTETVIEINGRLVRYTNPVEAIADAPDYSVIKMKLGSDMVFVSSETHNASYRQFTDAKVDDREQILDGIVVRKYQHLIVDLNGHKLSFDRHCFINRGYLQIDDSSKDGNGCCFTTNFSATVGGGYRHTDSSWYPETGYAAADCILNTGKLVINGGWFGTDTPTLKPRVNDVNWGLCLNISGGEAIINGGHFTTVTNQAKTGHGGFATTLARQLGDTSWLATANAEFPNASKGPWAFTVETHFTGRLTVNDGIFYGFTNGILGCVGDHGETTAEEYGAIDVNGGKFYIGFPDPIGWNTTVPGQSMAYAGTNGDSLIKWEYEVGDTIEEAKKTYTCQSMTLPSYLNGRKYKVASLSGSKVVRYTVYETFARVVINDGDFYFHENTGKIPFSGIVYIKGGRFNNYTINGDFIDAEFTSNKQTIVHVPYKEKPVEALARVDAMNDNFGSFCFLENLLPEEARAVAEWNAAKGYKYLYSLQVTADNCKEMLETVRDLSGTCYTLDKFDAFAQFMPMALFAATKYERANAAKLFMYQQFDGESPSVTTSREADLYDAFDVDGMGTRFPVNYYGCTRQGGTLVSFYQDGYNADKLDTACYCNEVWLKDAIAVELLNTFIALDKIPANNVGASIVRNAIITVLNEAIFNGTILVGTTLTNGQRTYVDVTAATEGAWSNVEDYGFWVDAKIRSEVLIGGRTQYKADYILLYSDGKAIRKVEGSDVLL